MKWETDLKKDVLSHTHADYLCAGIEDFLHLWPEAKEEPSVINPYLGEEVTECNRQALLDKFLEVKDTCKSILEIGIGRNGQKSFATIFAENKNKDTVYVGIDIEDRSWIVESGENMYTIQGNSSDYEEMIDIIKTNFNVSEFDFIFIDGLHSIDQVLKDWEYTNLLSDSGVVGLHDTNRHIGPYLFVRNLDTEVWDVEYNSCPNDNGIGFAKKIK